MKKIYCKPTIECMVLTVSENLLSSSSNDFQINTDIEDSMNDALGNSESDYNVWG